MRLFDAAGQVWAEEAKDLYQIDTFPVNPSLATSEICGLMVGRACDRNSPRRWAGVGRSPQTRFSTDIGN